MIERPKPDAGSTKKAGAEKPALHAKLQGLLPYKGNQI